MPTPSERITLCCKNPECPLPGRHFSVPIRFKNQRFCCRACATAVYWIERWAKAEASPPLTAEQFDQLSPNIVSSAAAKAAARLVLVDGRSIKEVAAVAQKTHGYVSRPVCQYRVAHEAETGL